MQHQSIIDAAKTVLELRRHKLEAKIWKYRALAAMFGEGFEYQHQPQQAIAMTVALFKQQEDMYDSLMNKSEVKSFVEAVNREVSDLMQSNLDLTGVSGTTSTTTTAAAATAAIGALTLGQTEGSSSHSSSSPSSSSSNPLGEASEATVAAAKALASAAPSSSSGAAAAAALTTTATSLPVVGSASTRATSTTNNNINNNKHVPLPAKKRVRSAALPAGEEWGDGGETGGGSLPRDATATLARVVDSTGRSRKMAKPSISATVAGAAGGGARVGSVLGHLHGAESPNNADSSSSDSEDSDSETSKNHAQSRLRSLSKAAGKAMEQKSRHLNATSTTPKPSNNSTLHSSSSVAVGGVANMINNSTNHNNNINSSGEVKPRARTMSRNGIPLFYWTDQLDDKLREAYQLYGNEGRGRWHLIASHVGSGADNKKCRLRWKNFIDYSKVYKRKSDWTDAEDVQLKALASKAERYISVRSAVGSNALPAPEDDVQVNLHNGRLSIDFMAISRIMGIAVQSVRARWRDYHKQINMKKGRFSAEEDETIVKTKHDWEVAGNPGGYALWLMLEAQLGRRSKHIKQRWVDFLSKQELLTKKGRFTPEEDQIIVETKREWELAGKGDEYGVWRELEERLGRQPRRIKQRYSDHLFKPISAQSV